MYGPQRKIKTVSGKFHNLLTIKLTLTSRTVLSKLMNFSKLIPPWIRTALRHLIQFALLLATHARASTSHHTQLTTRYQTSELTRISLTLRSMSLIKRNLRTTNGLQSKTKTVSGMSQDQSTTDPTVTNPSLNFNLTQSATLLDAQRASGTILKAKASQNTPLTQSVITDMMKTLSIQFTTR